MAFGFLETRSSEGRGTWRKWARGITAVGFVTAGLLGTTMPSQAFGELVEGTEDNKSATAGACKFTVFRERTATVSALQVSVATGSAVRAAGGVLSYQRSSTNNSRYNIAGFAPTASNLEPICGLSNVSIISSVANGTNYTSGTNYELEFTGIENGTMYSWHGRIYSATETDIPTSFLTKTTIDTPPTLSMATPVATPGNDATPALTFSSDEAGTITYGGACSSATTAAVAGNNAITLNTLADGTYGDCKITVTDGEGAASDPLTIPAFTIDTAQAQMVGGASLGVPTTSVANTDSVSFRVTFDEPVTGLNTDTFVTVPLGLDITDVQAETGNTSYLITVGGKALEAYEGTLRLSVGDPSSVTDAVGNTGFAWTWSSSYRIDRSVPTVSVSGPTAANGTFEVTVGISENVLDFNGGSDLTITNGAIDATTWRSVGNNKVGDIVPSGSPVTVQVKANSVTDWAGQKNPDPSNILSVDFDNTPPVISLTSGATTISNDTTPVFSITSDEAGTLSYGGSCSSATTAMPVGSLSIELNALSEGTYSDCTVQVTDAVGNASNVVTVNTFTIDTSAPTLTATIASNNAWSAIAKSGDTITLTITADEMLGAVPSVSIGGKSANVISTGGALDNFTATVTVDSSMSDGPAAISISGILDRAPNVAADMNAVTDGSDVLIDTTAPKMVGNATRVEPADQNTNSDTLTFDVVFDEFVSGGGASAFSVFGGSTATITRVDVNNGGMGRRITVSGGDLANYNGPVLLTRGDLSTIIDRAGNPVASFNGSEGFVLDNIAPAAMVTGPDNANAAFDVTIKFDGPVTNFDPLNLEVGNGAVDEVTWQTGSGTSFTGKIIPSGSPVSITASNGAARDEAGNLNAASNTLSVNFDNTAPIIWVTNAVPTLGNDNTPTFTLNSYEAGTITYGGACSSSTTEMVNGILDITLNALADGTYDNCTIQVTDALGNASPPVALDAFTIDTTAPTLEFINWDEGTTSPTAEDEIGFSLRFSERLSTAPGVADFSITGTTAVASVTGTTQFIDVRLAGGDLADLNGAVTIALSPGEALTDEAGNAMVNFLPTGTNQNTVQVINDQDPPVLEYVNIRAFSALGSDKAKVLDQIVLTFRSNEPLPTVPTVTIAGKTAAVQSVGQGLGDSNSPKTTEQYLEFRASIIVSNDIVLEGDVQFSISEVRDTKGNVASPVTATTDGSKVTIDTIRPTATLSLADPTVKQRASNPTPVTLNIEFSEPVAGFDHASNINGSGYTLSNFTSLSDRTYSVTLTPSGLFDVFVSLREDGIFDAFGNALQATDSLQIEVEDDVNPAVYISAPIMDFKESELPTRTVEIRFSEHVPTPDKSSITLTNATAVSLIPVLATRPSAAGALVEYDSFRDFILTVQPDGNGDVQVQVPARIATDIAGNKNQASEPLTLTMMDDVVPTVEITASVSEFDQSALTPFTVTFTFSEDVNPEGDPRETIQTGLQNATPSDFRIVTPDTVFAVTVTPNGNADVGISLPTGAARDDAGNYSLESNFLTIRMVDDIAPRVDLLADVKTFTKSALEERDVIVFFSEPVVQPAKDAISVENGTVTALVSDEQSALAAEKGPIAVDGGTYRLTVKPDGNGDVTVTVPAGITTDARNNMNSASAPLVLTMQDDIAPTVAIALSASEFDQSTLTPFTATFTFSKDVNFDTAPLAAINAALVNATAEDFTVVTADTVFSAVITPNGSGSVSVGFPADLARDSSGNKNFAAVPALARQVDDVSPRATLAAELTTFTKSALEERSISVTFTESVVKPDMTAIQIENGAGVSLNLDAEIVNRADEDQVDVDGARYTLVVKPDGNGDVTVTVPAGITTDARQNVNSASAPLVLTMLDDTIPSVVITLSANSMPLSALEPFTATYTFNKPVTFVGDGLASINAGLVNATASDLTPDASETVFTATVTPDGNGDVTVSLAESAAKDASDQPSTAAEAVVLRIEDDLAPEGAITGVPQSTNGSTAFDITVNFNEPVAGLTVDGFGLANAAISNLVAVSETSTSREFVGSANWTATITPDGGGDVSVEIGANAVLDESENTNPSRIGPYVAILDATDPTLISIIREGAETTDADVVSWIFEFSEPVTGFGPEDVDLAGQSGDVTITVEPLGNEGGDSATDRIAQRISSSHAMKPLSSASKLFRVTAFGGNITDGNTTLNIAINDDADIADENGNGIKDRKPKGKDDSVIVIVNDREAPTVTITAPASVTGPFDVTFTFSEPVTGFAADDVSLTNATISEPQLGSASRTTARLRAASNTQAYRATVTPTVHGDVTIGVLRGAVRDAAGNANLSSETITVTYTDVDLVQRRTGAAINNFVYRRAGNILATQPDLSGRLDDSGGLGATEPFVFAAKGDGDSLNIEFAGSLTRLMSRELIAPYAALNGSGLGEGAEFPRFNIWTSGSLSQSKVGGQRQDFGVLHFGADYRINQAFLVGAMGQFDYAEEHDPVTGISASGEGWMIGPYTVIRLRDTLTFDGRALWGRSSNSISPFGTYVDQFDTERFLLKAQLTGKFDVSGWTVSPQIALAYINETQQAYVNAANVPIAERTVEIGQLSFGPTVSQIFTLDDGVTITPRFSLKGLWNFKDTGLADIDTGVLSGGEGDSLRARVDMGVKTEFGLGANLDLSSFIEGIGDEENTIYGGAAKLSILF